MAKFIYKVQEVQNGTASAINLAKEFVGDEPFAVLFGDDVMYNETRPVIGQLIDVYEKYGKTVLGCKRVSMDVISKYASVEYDKILENDVYNMTKVTENPKRGSEERSCAARQIRMLARNFQDNRQPETRREQRISVYRRARFNREKRRRSRLRFRRNAIRYGRQIRISQSEYRIRTPRRGTQRQTERISQRTYRRIMRG